MSLKIVGRQPILALAFITLLAAGATSAHAESYPEPNDCSDHGFVDEAPDHNATATGVGATATGCWSTATGNGANAPGFQSTATGSHAQGTGSQSTATGYYATASGDMSTATGTQATASGDQSVATGMFSNASGESSTATGTGTSATGLRSTSTGFIARASGDYSTANGSLANAEGRESVAEGYSAQATGAQSTAVGSNTNASGAQSTALGNGAQATASNSVAVGANSIADEDNTVSVGSEGAERRITHVDDGISGTDAVNVRQMRAADEWTLNQANSYTDFRFDDLSQQINTLNSRVDGLDLRLNKVGAMAGALAMMTGSAAGNPSKSKIAVGVASYNGQSAIAFGYQRLVTLKSGRPIVFTLGASFAGSERTIGGGMSIGLR